MSVINTSNFKKIKVKKPCRKKIFDMYPEQSFIVVLDDNGKVIIYDEHQKNTFNNLRDVISLFGSDFFKKPISDTDIGKALIDYYEKSTGLKVREIYKCKL